METTLKRLDQGWEYCETKVLFTWREVDPNARKILEGGSSLRHVFSIQFTCKKVVLGPSARIFLAERWEDPSTRIIQAPCKQLSLVRS